jgi:HAD superfamily hydrolase (TIGR01549 family)
MIKAVFIDLAKTLIDHRSFADIEKELELPFWSTYGYEGNLKQLKKAKEKTKKEFFKKGFRNKKENCLWGLIFAKNLGIKPDEKIAIRDHEVAMEYYSRKSKLRKGAIELLEYLKGRGIKMALISNNWSDMANVVINSLKIRKYFDYIIISDEVGAVKSEFKPFQVALKKMRLKPEECMMVGDCEEDMCCQKLGIKFVWLDSDREGKKINYDYKINEIIELKNIVG